MPLWTFVCQTMFVSSCMHDRGRNFVILMDYCLYYVIHRPYFQWEKIIFEFGRNWSCSKRKMSCFGQRQSGVSKKLSVILQRFILVMVQLTFLEFLSKKLTLTKVNIKWKMYATVKLFMDLLCINFKSMCASNILACEITGLFCFGALWIHHMVIFSGNTHEYTYF